MDTKKNIILSMNKFHGHKFKYQFCQEKSHLPSKFFPAKIPFSEIQKKNLAGKNYFAKERGPFC
jgi:hypothetical protein